MGGVPMSCFYIQYVQGQKILRPVRSKEEYLKLRDSDRQKWLVSEIRRGLKDGSMSKEEIAKLKRQLLQFNYSCIPGEDGHLKGVKTPSMTFGMDIDFDPEDPDYEKKMAEVPQRVMEKKDEIKPKMLERSPGKGYHLVCMRTILDGIAEGRILENQEMNLKRVSEILQIPFDQNARDCTRIFYATTASEEDLIFLDEGLFEAEKAECISVAKHPETGITNKPEPAASDLSYQGIAYSAIIKKYWDMFYDGKEPCMGDRNVRTFEICMLLRSICDYSQEILEAVIPRYDGFPVDEWRRTIDSALKEPRKGMPYKLKQVLDALRQEKKLQLMANGKTTGGTVTNINGQLSVMPERPKRMPKFLNLVSSKVDPYYKAMVEESIWPGVCAHLHGVKFWYIDGVDCEANISSPLIGKQSSGKGLVNNPIEYVLADIPERDRENVLREEQ